MVLRILSALRCKADAALAAASLFPSRDTLFWAVGMLSRGRLCASDLAFCSAPRPGLQTAGPGGNSTCGRSGRSGYLCGPHAGLGGRHAARPDRRRSRETPEAPESYLGCRRCPRGSGILTRCVAVLLCPRCLRGERPAGGQAPPSGRGAAGRGAGPRGESLVPGGNAASSSHVGGFPGR